MKPVLGEGFGGFFEDGSATAGEGEIVLHAEADFRMFLIDRLHEFLKVEFGPAFFEFEKLFETVIDLSQLVGKQAGGRHRKGSRTTRHCR